MRELQDAGRDTSKQGASVICVLSGCDQWRAAKRSRSYRENFRLPCTKSEQIPGTLSLSGRQTGCVSNQKPRPCHNCYIKMRAEGAGRADGSQWDARAGSTRGPLLLTKTHQPSRAGKDENIQQRRLWARQSTEASLHGIQQLGDTSTNWRLAEMERSPRAQY